MIEEEAEDVVKILFLNSLLFNSISNRRSIEKSDEE